MEAVNGKVYPMWGQFVDRKDEWIGGILEETQDSWPRVPGEAPQTKITNITLKPNGDDSAYFEVEGEKYSCGCDVHHLGITKGEPGWITLSGYGGHEWRIKQKEKSENSDIKP